MRCVIPQPCIGSRDIAFRTSMSSVACITSRFCAAIALLSIAESSIRAALPFVKGGGDREPRASVMVSCPAGGDHQWHPVLRLRRPLLSEQKLLDAVGV